MRGAAVYEHHVVRGEVPHELRVARRHAEIIRRGVLAHSLLERLVQQLVQQLAKQHEVAREIAPAQHAGDQATASASGIMDVAASIWPRRSPRG